MDDQLEWTCLMWALGCICTYMYLKSVEDDDVEPEVISCLVGRLLRLQRCPHEFNVV
jgi:hypothetical protein